MASGLKRKQELFAGIDSPAILRQDAGVVLKPCALCGGRDARRIYMQAHFPVVKCRVCGLIYADEHFRADELAQFYTGDYYQRAYVCHPREIDRKIARDYVRQFMRVAAGRSGGRLLDFGSARGTFLGEIRRRGLDREWELRGIDINPDEVRMGQDAGLPVTCGDIFARELPEAAFDVVTAFSVLEHMQDPIATLRELRRVTRPGGSLVFVVPAGNCLIVRLAELAARVLGNSVRSFTDNVFHEEHLYYFTRQTVAAAFRLAGLEPLGTWGGPSYLETHPTSPFIAVPAYGLRAASFILRRQTMLVAAARRPNAPS